jgi:hypothetical protein
MTKNISNKPDTKRSLASSKSGLSGITSSPAIIDKGADLAVWFIKGTIVIGGLYLLYRSYTNRFVKLKENSNYPLANVTVAQAKNRADAIGASIGWVSNDFDQVSQNLAGLNYNGFIRVYNEFGHQTGTLLGGDLNLIEWIKNQFSEYEVSQLSTLLNGAFFKGLTLEDNPIEILFNQFPKRVQ